MSPYAVGWIRDMTHSTMYAVLALAAAFLVSAALVFVVMKEEKPAGTHGPE